MIGLIVLGAFDRRHVRRPSLRQFARGRDSSLAWLAPFVLIMVLIVFYLILGTVLEGFSMIVLTLPIVLPVVLAAGFDKLWFGIFLVLVIEMAQITLLQPFSPHRAPGFS